MVYCLFDDGVIVVFFFKQKTAYEMRISDWSSDVCSSDLGKSECTSIAGEPPGHLVHKPAVALQSQPARLFVERGLVGNEGQLMRDEQIEHLGHGVECRFAALGDALLTVEPRAEPLVQFMAGDRKSTR